MRKIKKILIEIDEKTKKEFVVKELTLEQLLSLLQTNTVFGSSDDDKEDKKGGGFLGDLVSFASGFKELYSEACSADFEDLKKLAPSDIDLIYQGFLEVNQTFLDLMETLGIKAVILKIVKESFSGFLKMHVI